jgi:arginyl-tRNA synthetase
VINFKIESRLQKAVLSAYPDADPTRILIRPCPDPKFGDYQCNSLMNLAKGMKKNPRDVAAEVLKHLDLGGLGDSPEVAGPGFLNFRISRNALSHVMNEAFKGEHLFYRKPEAVKSFVVDFSSPNVAKTMHVGHIRSTILGESISRTLRLLGHSVVSDNHIGDWGTQFGKLLYGWKSILDREALERKPVEEMERVYKAVNQQCEQDETVLKACRNELVRLQSGDTENRKIWESMIQLSRGEFDRIYQRMDVGFDVTLGESFYNDRLISLVNELEDAGIDEESKGARMFFFNDHPELKNNPAMVRKKDGAANYMTTDLATLEYREKTWQPDEVIYVTDSRQQLHFKQLFAAYRRWKPDTKVKLTHAWFGSILGEDGKPFKTRTGKTIRLSHLLDESIERAREIIEQKNSELPEESKEDISREIGLGAVKYADLLQNRQTDYTFSWEKMLALNGNTAPYLQYAYTRIRSIFRRIDPEDWKTIVAQGKSEDLIILEREEEFQLAKQLIHFGLVLEKVIEECRPNHLCSYLYELAGCFARFYEHCPVLKAEPAEKRSRLAICDLTAKVLCQGLNLLGINTVEQM